MNRDDYDSLQVIDCMILTDVVNFLDDLQNLSVMEENTAQDLKRSIDIVKWLSDFVEFKKIRGSE